VVNLSGKKEKIDKVKIIFSLIFTLIFFSLFEIVSKKIELDSFSLTGIRFFLGGLFILIFFMRTVINEFKNLDSSLKIKIFLSGFLNVSIAMLSLQLAVKLGNATTSAIIISSNPIFVYLIQNIMHRIKEKQPEKAENILDIVRFMLLILGAIGIILVIYKKDKGDSFLSIFFAILASITFATYTLFSKKLLKRVSSVTLNSISFSTNGLLLLLFSILISRQNIINFIRNFYLEKIIYLFILSFGITGLAYITYFYALKKLEATKVSLVFYLKPIVVLLFNFLLLNENVGFNKFIGIIVIIISLFIYVNLDKFKKFVMNKTF